MTFERFLNQIDKNAIDKLLKARLPDDVLSKLQSTLNSEITTVRGGPFYLILNVISENFENDVHSAFGEYFENKKWKPKNEPKLKDNRYKSFIRQFLTLQKDIADKAKIENTRLSKVLSREVKDFLAWEVYAIARSQNKTVESAFAALYK